MLYYFFYMLLPFAVIGKISIKDASVATVTRGDIGMIFYLTLVNTEDVKFRIFVKMEKCCEQITPRDKDCDSMVLLGGDMGVLNSRCSKNITLVYPNMYLHNRQGKCLISVTYLNEQRQAFRTQQNIAFNTTISKVRVPSVLRGYYTIEEVKECAAVDLDPLEDCQPVNCPMKYLGFRNYFNQKWKRCQKVPVCIADVRKSLPDVAYIPISNRCRDLEGAISTDDLKYLQQGIVQGSWGNSNYLFLTTNLRCHHGDIDNETGFCVCDEGWMSAPFDKDQYEPGLSLYHMCNIQIDTWNGVNSTRIKMTLLFIALCAVFITILILLCIFILNGLYRCIKIFEDDNCCAAAAAETHRKHVLKVKQRIPKNVCFDKCLYMGRKPKKNQPEYNVS